MRVAVIGPVCRDEIIIGRDGYSQLGGVTYYAGQALACLGADVTILGSFGEEEDLRINNCKLIHAAGKRTIKFVNEYPDASRPDYRKQRAVIPKNKIKHKNIKRYVNHLDCVIMGPLFHNNISKKLIKKLRKCKAEKALAAQGMIRYLKGDKIIWKKRENVLGILKYIDYLFLDEEELNFITSGKGAGYLQGKGARNVIVTNGVNGSRLFLEDKVYEIKAFQPNPELADPTGAGDSYMAGYIKALELYDHPESRGSFATMTATISIEEKGAFNKTLDYVLERLVMEKLK